MLTSLLGFVITAALGFASMGLLGVFLFEICLPVLSPLFGIQSIDALTGDIWPILILIGMTWSLGFLFAGWFQHFLLQRFKWHSLVYTGIYLIVLWLWALVLWGTFVGGNLDNVDYGYLPPRVSEKLISEGPSWKECSILLELNKKEYR